VPGIIAEVGGPGFDHRLEQRWREQNIQGVLGVMRHLEMIEAQPGMSPWQAIVASTESIADAVGLGDRLGSVEAGKWADLIAVAKDPLADIRHLREPVLVVRGGAIAVNHVSVA
jgi:imidazolonepropionase-like amidohydrolase